MAQMDSTLNTKKDSNNLFKISSFHNRKFCKIVKKSAIANN